MLEEIGPAKGVVVQQHDQVSVAGRDSAVCGGRVAWIDSVSDQCDVWKKRTDILGRSVCRSTVGDDDLVLDRLVPELLQAHPGELPAVMGRNDNVDQKQSPSTRR